jgi:hypothetical protein
MTTPNLFLPELAASQSQPHITLNSALRRLDAVVQLSVISQTNAPPGSPTDGDRYLVGSSPTGDWTGHDQEVAAYIGTAWQFFVPVQGWLAYDRATAALLVFGAGSPSGWVEIQTGGGGAPTLVDLGMFFPGNPGSSQLLFKFVAARAMTFPANFAGSRGEVGTDPASAFVMDVDVNAFTVGTISVSTSGVFTFATSGGSTQAVAAGDVITISGPISADGSIADIAATLVLDL